MSSVTPTWIFDLDNTLHDARPYIFPHLHETMTAYVARHLRLDWDAASALRVAYAQTYGATLAGLVRHHQVDPHHFLWHTHQFPNLGRMIVAPHGLVRAMQRLRGRRVVFSNGPAHYVDAIMQRLGLARCFDAVYAIEHTGYRPKPSLHGYWRVLAAERQDPRRCIMVEDTAANLRAAKRLGMRTIWMSREPRRPAYVDQRIDTVHDLAR